MARPPKAPPDPPGLFGQIAPAQPSIFNPTGLPPSSGDPLIGSLAPAFPDAGGYLAGPGGTLMRSGRRLDPSARFDPANPAGWMFPNQVRGASPAETQAWLERKLGAGSQLPGQISPQEAMARAMAPKQDVTDTAAVEPLLRQISKGEGTDDETAKERGYPSGHDVIYYGSRVSPRTPLTQMSLDKVLRLQQQMRKQGGSDAVGKYQFQGATLAGLKSRLGLSGDEPFDPSLQERLGRELLKKRGVGKYGAGAMDFDTMTSGLSDEWTSIGNPAKNGRTHDGRASRTTVEQIRQATASLRPFFGNQTPSR